MATAYEVTLMGTLVTEQVINRLGFVTNIDDVGSTSASALLQALGYLPSDPETPEAFSFFVAFLAAQTASYQLDEILVRNLFSVTDFITQPVTGIGWQGGITIAAGDRLPTFVASKLRTNRVRTDVRRGTLALTGGTEEQMSGVDAWDSGYMTLLQALANELNTPPSFTGGGTTTLYRPSVFGKERYEVPGSDPVRYAYRYYPSLSEQIVHTAQNVTWSPVEAVSSQVSRKIGRGA